MALELTKNNVTVAERLLAEPLFNEILSELENEALNMAVQVPLTDSESVQAWLGEVRAIRSLRQRLRVLIARAKANPDKGASD
jgi:hypothetical protein